MLLFCAVVHTYNAINHIKEKSQVEFYFTKKCKKVESILCQVPTSIINMGKKYAIHIELFAYLPALPAASPVCSCLL